MRKGGRINSHEEKSGRREVSERDKKDSSVVRE